mmetsp:Transcript_3160/g.7396  ORF Transcript_3160/g.7396 Transcript_3160/m.7396 type:complete len:213 (+) Transcript_3160:600-1238(+)
MACTAWLFRFSFPRLPSMFRIFSIFASLCLSAWRLSLSCAALQSAGSTCGIRIFSFAAFEAPCTEAATSSSAQSFATRPYTTTKSGSSTLLVTKIPKNACSRKTSSAQPSSHFSTSPVLNPSGRSIMSLCSAVSTRQMTAARKNTNIQTKNTALLYWACLGPPSSPPNSLRRPHRCSTTKKRSTRKAPSVKAKSVAGYWNWSSDPVVPPWLA